MIVAHGSRAVSEQNGTNLHALLQAAGSVATELQKMRADMEQEKRAMQGWLDQQKRQVEQTVNTELAKKDQACDALVSAAKADFDK